MNDSESRLIAGGRDEYCGSTRAVSSPKESQPGQEFDLQLMTSPTVRTVTADVHFVTRSSSCAYGEDAGKRSESLPTPCADNDSSKTRLLTETCQKTEDETSGRNHPRSGLYENEPNDQSPKDDRRRKNGFGASGSVDSPAPSSSNTGARFKFPTVKMGAFLSRKKRSCPAFSSLAEGAAAGDQSPTLSIGEHGLTYNNSDHAKTAFSPVDGGVGGKNASETNSLLFRRLNNRLRGRKMTTPAKPQADFYQMTSLEGGLEEASAACRLLSSRYPPHQSMARRLFSKEDPGPSNVALITVAAVATTAAIVDEIGAIGSSASDIAGSSSECSKSSSFATAFDACYKASTSTMASTGAKYKLVKEGQIQVCRLNHPRTLLGKLTSSKLLRRWETHTLILEADEIRSKTVSLSLSVRGLLGINDTPKCEPTTRLQYFQPTGFLEQPIKYVNMEDIHALSQWDSSGDKFCVRIFVPEGSVLLQVRFRDPFPGRGVCPQDKYPNGVIILALSEFLWTFYARRK